MIYANPQPLKLLLIMRDGASRLVGMSGFWRRHLTQFMVTFLHNKDLLDDGQTASWPHNKWSKQTSELQVVPSFFLFEFYFLFFFASLRSSDFFGQILIFNLQPVLPWVIEFSRVSFVPNPRHSSGLDLLLSCTLTNDAEAGAGAAAAGGGAA